jgi:hypothetical protein
MELTHTFTTYTEAAAALTAKHPAAARMASHALAIVEAGKVHPMKSGTGAVVFSEANKSMYTTTLEADGPHCTCPAHKYRPAMINGRPYCKHLMALGIYDAVRGN